MSSSAQLASKLTWLSAQHLQNKQWLSALHTMLLNIGILSEQSNHRLHKGMHWRSNSSVLFKPYAKNFLRCVLSAVIENNNIKLWKRLKHLVSLNPALREYIDACHLSSALGHLSVGTINFCRCMHARGLPPTSNWSSFQQCPTCGAMQIILRNEHKLQDMKKMHLLKSVIQSTQKEIESITRIGSQLDMQIKALNDARTKPEAPRWSTALAFKSLLQSIRVEKLSHVIGCDTSCRLERIKRMLREKKALYPSTISFEHAQTQSIKNSRISVMRELESHINVLKSLKKEIFEQSSALVNKIIRLKKEIKRSRSQSMRLTHSMYGQYIDWRMIAENVTVRNKGSCSYHTSFDFGTMKIDTTIPSSSSSIAARINEKPLLTNIVEWTESKLSDEQRRRHALPHSRFFSTVRKEMDRLSLPCVYPFSFDAKDINCTHVLYDKENFQHLNQTNIFIPKQIPQVGHMKLLIFNRTSDNHWQESIRLCLRRLERDKKTKLMHEKIQRNPFLYLETSQKISFIDDCPTCKVSNSHTESAFSGQEMVALLQENTSKVSFLDLFGVLRSLSFTPACSMEDKIVRAISSMHIMHGSRSNRAEKDVPLLLKDLQTRNLPAVHIANVILRALKNDWARGLQICTTLSEFCLDRRCSKSDMTQVIVYILSTLRRHQKWHEHRQIAMQPISESKLPAAKTLSKKSLHLNKGFMNDPLLLHEAACAIKALRVPKNKPDASLAAIDGTKAYISIERNDTIGTDRVKSMRRLRSHMWANGLALSSYTLDLLLQQSPFPCK